jgi:putative inorganic carbon (hco3(-)) transporter
MRDLFLLGLVAAALPFAARFTWAAVLLWTWISIMNPHKLAYGFAYGAPFAAVAAGAAAVSLIFNRDRFKLPASPIVVVLILFVMWMCVTTFFAYFPESSWIQLNKVLKIQLMTLIAMVALRERKHIEYFIWVNVLSIGFYGFKGGIFTISTGGSSRVWGPPGGFIEGNNEIALAMIISIPLMNYLRMVSTHKYVRLGLLVLMVLSVISAIGTQSRGAFLAISAMGLLLWTRSDRKLVTGIVVAVIALAVINFMPESWSERMNTIQTYDQDGSALGRINAWWMAFNLANSRFLGGGFEIYTASLFAMYAPVPDDIKVAHSIYFSVLGEHGYIGLILFLSLGWLGFRVARQIRNQTAKQAETQWASQLAAMCQVSLVGYAVGGAFLSLAYFDLPYNILIILVVSLRWLQEKKWQTEPQGAFGSGQPVGAVRLAGLSNKRIRK